MAPKAEGENNQAAVSDSQTTDAPSVVENTGGGSTPTTAPGTDAPAAEGNKASDTIGTEENAAGSSTTDGAATTGGAVTARRCFRSRRCTLSK